MKNIAVFTGTRADYGLLYWLLKDIEKDVELNLQLIVSGMHLSPEFGLSKQQIKDDGFIIAEEIEMLLSSDTPAGCAKSVGLGIISFTDCLQRLSPDLLVVLGDRFEALAIVQTAMILNIPIAHIHGGEITQGAKDDYFRHAITKLSSLHFTSCNEHSNRVIQLGEQPERVFNVGSLGLEHIHRTKLMSKAQLTKSLTFDVEIPYFLVTYHSVTLMAEEPQQAFMSLLAALDEFPQINVIFTYPNADEGGRKIISLLEQYAQLNSHRVLAIPSLGQVRYLSAVKYAKAVIGNSSSGVIEVPAFNVASINIGCRQLGRLCAPSVRHCAAEKQAISLSITKVLTPQLSIDAKDNVNPYGLGHSAHKIITIIKQTELSKTKVFFDLAVANTSDNRCDE